MKDWALPEINLQRIKRWLLMLPSILLAFREGLEAALIVSIVLSYLKKMGYRQRATVWWGVASAVTVSIVAGIALGKDPYLIGRIIVHIDVASDAVVGLINGEVHLRGAGPQDEGHLGRRCEIMRIHGAHIQIYLPEGPPFALEVSGIIARR